MLGHTVWTVLSTSKYTVGNDLALASLSWLDDIIFFILNFEVNAFFLLGEPGRRTQIESYKLY